MHSLVGVWKGHLLLLGSGSPIGIALVVFFWDDCGLFSGGSAQVGFIIVRSVGVFVTHLEVICDLWTWCQWCAISVF